MCVCGVLLTALCVVSCFESYSCHVRTPTSIPGTTYQVYECTSTCVYGGKKIPGYEKKEADDDPFMVTEFTPPVNPCSTAVLYIGTAQ